VSGRYTVDLDALLAFADRLAKFNVRAEQIATAVDQYIAELHASWLGEAASASQEYHEKWMAAAKQMREGLEELRKNAHVAHRNYTEVVRLNTAMWP
jgi:WXG100 family type VII secretion target